MFKFLKKKEKKDPILDMIEEQTRQLKEITDSMRNENDSLDQQIKVTEELLKQKGFTEKDLERIRQRAKMKIISKNEEA